VVERPRITKSQVKVIHFFTQPAFKKQEGFLFHSHEKRALDDPSKICPESRVVSRGTKSALAWLKDGNLSTKSRPKKERKKGSESGISPAPKFRGGIPHQIGRGWRLPKIVTEQ